MLFQTAPRPGDADLWIRQFNATFADADYVAIGIDSPSGLAGASDEFVALGLRVDVHAVLTAASLRPPANEPPDPLFRRVESDRDWERSHRCKPRSRPA
jgi:hypothetical protein